MVLNYSPRGRFLRPDRFGSGLSTGTWRRYFSRIVGEMKYYHRPSLFMAAVELLPHIHEGPLSSWSDAQVAEAVDKAVDISRLIGDKFTAGPWGPTISPMPSIRDPQPPTDDQATSSKPEWIRLPKKGKCPHCGLSRSSLYALVAPVKTNDFRPPVKSVVIRNRGAARGIRLISYDSLMDHLSALGPDKTGGDVT